jgi:hypothetical protein
MGKSLMWQHMRDFISNVKGLPYVGKYTFGDYYYFSRSNYFKFTKKGVPEADFMTRVQYITRGAGELRKRYMTELRVTLPHDVFTVNKYMLLHRKHGDSPYPQVEQRWIRDGSLHYLVAMKGQKDLAWSNVDLENTFYSPNSKSLLYRVQQIIKNKQTVLYGFPISWQINYELELTTIFALSEIEAFFNSLQ